MSYGIFYSLRKVAEREYFDKDNQFGYHVRFNADGISMEDCKLVPFFKHHEESNKVFELPLYKDGFQKIVLRPGELMLASGGIGMMIFSNHSVPLLFFQ